ncbi:MAG: tRNA (N(6)-L-threonylcarbamoyladenosine(37)-C(2))-methylthiotransferase MtaB [Pseudomonadota bacterium]
MAQTHATDGTEDTPHVVTFGCRLNAYESEVIREAAAGGGETVVINSCAVTNEAVRQARQAVRKARREAPSARVIITGCAAQTEPETFAAMPEVDLVLGNEEKLRPESYRRTSLDLDALEKVRVNDIMGVRETAPHLVDGLQGRSRAYVQVQTGCDHRCTFCIIPYGRGNARSVGMGEVIAQIRRLVETGHLEVVLTGVDITSYGADLPGHPRLGTLVRAILRHVPELQRLRLSSIDSIEADDDLMRALAEEERLMPHLHLSLQSGDDMILKRMKRRHLSADAIQFCREARGLRPDIVFGADIIAGFPTETEEMFQNSLKIVDACDLTHLHVFPFSPRKGTPAARMPQLDRSLIKTRAERLRHKGQEALTHHLASEVGQFRRVLVEKPGFGRTDGFTQVDLARGPDRGVVQAQITGHDGTRLQAVAA